MTVERLDGASKAQLQALIYNSQWSKVARWLPEDLRIKYQEYQEATHVVHTPRDAGREDADS